MTRNMQGAPRLTDAEVARYHAKVNRTDACWEWTGELNRHGYGRFTTYPVGGRRRILAHRLGYFLATGEWPALLRHTCDKPRCVRPDHLIPGTQSDNIRDAVERNRADLSGLAAWRRDRTQQVLERLRSGRKTCTRCRAEKSMDDFGTVAANPDGHSTACKACLRALARERRERQAGEAA